MRHLTRTELVVVFYWLSTWAAVFVFLTSQRVLAAEVIVAVKSVEAGPFADAFQGFKEALAKSGYQVTIREYTVKEGGREEARVLSDIKQRRPALILTLGSAATTLVHRQVQDVPVVFCMVLNPVASGFVQSLQSSGNNLTGASLDIPVGLQFETLQAVVPAVKKVGVLYNPQETGEVVSAAAQVATAKGLELIAIPVSAAEKLQEALEQHKKQLEALWSVADSTVFASDRAIEFLLRKTLEYKLPFMGLSPGFVKAGALLALSVDYTDVGAQCGEQAAQVLSGRPPTSLPITTPRKVTLYLNANVARAIGVTIPPHTMERAVVLK
jgi:putative ABC transport system substrate-binding protein